MKRNNVVFSSFLRKVSAAVLLSLIALMVPVSCAQEPLVVETPVVEEKEWQWEEKKSFPELLSFSVSEDGESILIYLRGIEDKSLNSGDEYTVLSVRGTVKVLKEDTIWHVFFNEEEIGTFTYR